MNWKNLLIVGLILAAFTATSVFAVEGGNARKGKHLYKKNCKTCHVKGGDAKDLTPMSKTMAQWDRYFKRTAKKHPGDAISKLNEKDLKDINQFLYNSAADSPAPATCG
jgi:mono/diheme cytochrome c family protein